MNASVMQTDVLVVDDEEPIRTAAAEILGSASCSVLEAFCGQDALEWLESVSVGFLMLDVPMPGRSDTEVLEAFDSPPSVIRMSALRFEGKDEQSVGHKVFSHLVKRVAPRRQLDVVETALGSGELM